MRRRLQPTAALLKCGGIEALEAYQLVSRGVEERMRHVRSAAAEQHSKACSKVD